jgi:recombination associated protein RdgC
MWFKNITLFRLTEPFTLSANELEEKLAAMRYRPCGAQEETSLGWVAPAGNQEILVHAANGHLMLCANLEKKLLPANVIREKLDERVEEIEIQENRKLAKKEKSQLKDELVFDLLAKAFSYSQKTYAYLDPKNGWLVINTGSTKGAEDVLTLLRKSLGSFPAKPISTANNPVNVMTDWLLSQSTPNDITVEDECELRAPEDEGGIIRCKRHDLSLPEIQNHLNSGKEAVKLAINWEDRVVFILDQHLAIKRLRFLDLILDQLQDETGFEDEIARFDIEFTIMTAELEKLITRLIEIFGGEAKTE